ncbi:HAMP domain-containing sensor histidine kinase [Nocardia sp. NPDC049707]|uniref:sensor histidine kinase n=1 Tax=Nocardia sp. NPDC049707 TaxID=3154735 RepID=UPI00342146DD
MRSPKGTVSLSLRARVALVSGVVAALVAVTLGIGYTALLDATGSRQFDETVSTMGVAIAPPLDAPPHVLIRALPDPPSDLALPGPVIVAPGDVRTTVAGAPGLVVRLEADRALVDSAIRRSQLIGIAIGITGVLLAAVLGWFLAGYAARPLRRLATATHGIDTLEQLPPLSGRGAREAEELSDAITHMLARLEAAHGATNRALASARDFAAVCAHELRTPLTAMRTDLEVLATKELPAEQQRAVLADVLLVERQIENTLTELEQLAVGELTESDAFEPFELCETLDRAVQDARRRHPEVSIDLTECTPTTVTGLPGGLMLIVTNAVANAVQHGHAHTITVAARRPDSDAVDIIIDDDGTGIPATLHPTAFDRFVKGHGSPGSGLGLALVRQQAELHSGTAELNSSPLGGVRLRVRINPTR